MYYQSFVITQLKMASNIFMHLKSPLKYGLCNGNKGYNAAKSCIIEQ